jgi:hypothetical protein
VLDQLRAWVGGRGARPAFTSSLSSASWVEVLREGEDEDGAGELRAAGDGLWRVESGPHELEVGRGGRLRTRWLRHRQLSYCGPDAMLVSEFERGPAAEVSLGCRNAARLLRHGHSK